ncbi:MAG: hypothetical protein ACNFW9_02160 [Candidatus Kerfeldbacteria bacterium]|jgi:hypothetical protein
MKLKKVIYLILSELLFIIIGYGLHAILELVVLNSNNNITWYTHFSGSCALHPIISYGLFIASLVAGVVVGLNWWRIVYIERRHWRFKKNKE